MTGHVNQRMRASQRRATDEERDALAARLVNGFGR